MPEVGYLSEMMNFPGVLSGDKEVMAKLGMAAKAGKPVDGHAPGLMGSEAEKYIKAGISTDHECYTLAEAREKIRYGMHVLIREGSAAKNFETLYPLIDEYPEMVMLCSDDKHPNDLVAGHINGEVKRAISLGMNVMNVLRCCTYNPVKHYNLKAGLLQLGDPADLIRVDNLNDFNILETYINGMLVAENGTTLIPHVKEVPCNRFETCRVNKDELAVEYKGGDLKIIQALEGQLITGLRSEKPLVAGGKVRCDTSRDILKLVVKNRYSSTPVSVGFISGFGMKKGALASCVAHDSHNIVAVGTDDDSIAEAINKVVDAGGGISLADGTSEGLLPLPFAGIMSGDDGYQVARKYDKMDKRSKEMGCVLHAPYMTLSFMALLVIPSIKLSDKGLFDGNTFTFTDLFTS
jgi:adenine deaminase